MAYPLEVMLFSLIHFLPYLMLELLAFRRSLRFSCKVTVMQTILFSVIVLAVSLWLAPNINRNWLILIQSTASGLFFLLSAKDQIGKKLFTLLIIANDANLVLALTGHIQHRLLPETTASPYHLAGSLLMLLIEVLVLSPMFIYIRMVYAHTLSGKRRLNAWNVLWLIPLTFCMVWITLFVFGNTGLASGQFALVSLMLSLGTVFVYVMVTYLIKEHCQKEELQEKEYALAMQQAQYVHLQERIEEARRAKHDLRHHIHLVSAYLNDGKLEELQAYLQKYTDTFSFDSRMLFCSHYAVNALLAFFAQQAHAARIRYDVSVNIPARLTIPDEDLVVVLGNLLENAINACKEEDTPAICIYGRTNDNALFFKITNTCTQYPPKLSCSQSSMKKPGQGIGLKSVENIARRYDGMMEAGLQDQLFVASVMLMLPDTPERNRT